MLKMMARSRSWVAAAIEVLFITASRKRVRKTVRAALSPLQAPKPYSVSHAKHAQFLPAGPPASALIDILAPCDVDWQLKQVVANSTCVQ